MKVFVFIFSAFAFCFLVSCRPAAAPISISEKPVSINDVPQTNLPMPPSKPLAEMSWTSFDDKLQKLGDLKGKAVVLDFWATNCPPCIEEIPHLNRLQTEYGAENLQIVGLHAGDDEDRLGVPAFAKRLKINYLLAVPERALSSFIFNDGDEIPRTAVFDRDGKLVQKFVGYDLQTKYDLDKAVERAVKQ
ncbi:MAG: TlpA family protein disulfide reductase [Acidobacteria bacterium]|jgi:cytochrome c biogenesis protein CcmG/thiol:disulfide interchange protein DsbE|nr:TlpA family protein disulfide reductase [Acidobacteriota bacterium]